MKLKMGILVMLVLMYSAVSFAYTVDGDTVYINDSRAYISATPHTITSSGWVYINLTSKTFSGDIDVAFGFDTALARPIRAELYSPHTYYWNDSYVMNVYNVSGNTAGSGSCDYGNEYNTYKRNVTWSYVDNVTAEQKNNIFCFDSYENVSNDYRIVWHTEESEARDWKDYSSAFDSADYEHGGMNKWWYVKDVPVSANQSYLMRGYVNIPVIFGEGTSAKYWVSIKRSADTISEAVSNDRFYSLDPYWNSSWLNRKKFTFTDSVNISRPDEVIFYNLSSDSDISDVYNYSDIRIIFDDNITTREMPSEVVNGSVLQYTGSGNENHSFVVFTADLTLSGDYYIYYNNSGATKPSYSGITESSGTAYSSDCTYLINNTKLSWWLCKGIDTNNRNGFRRIIDNTQGLDFASDKYAYDDMMIFNGATFYDEVFDITRLYDGDVIKVYMINFTAVPEVQEHFTFYYNTSRWDAHIGSTLWNGAEYWAHNTLGTSYFDYYQTSENATAHPIGSAYYNLSYASLINSTNNYVAGFSIEPRYAEHGMLIQSEWGSGGLNNDWINNQTFKEVYESPNLLGYTSNLSSSKKLFYPVNVTVGAEESEALPSVALIFDFSVIAFGSVFHNTTGNSAVNNYTITVNVTGNCTPRITFEIPNPPLTYTAYNISNDNVFFNYTIQTTPYPTLLSLDINRTINVTDTDNIYPEYYLDVPYLQRAGAYVGNHTITGWCA